MCETNLKKYLKKCPHEKPNTANVLKWFENWHMQYLQTVGQPEKSSLLITIDNPGWGMTVDLSDRLSDHPKVLLSDVEKTENDWFYCAIENNKFEAAGGPFNLYDILLIFQMYVEKESGLTLIENSNLTWLQNWYYSCCDEDWEHMYGIVIQTSKVGGT